MTPTLAPAAAPQVRWGMLGKVFLTWLRKNIPSVLVTAVIGAIFGYVSNVWMVSVVYQGTNGVMPGSTAMGPNNIATPAFIWGLGSALLFGVFGYYRGVGGARFWAGVRGLPDTVRGLFTAAGATARAALLWGAAVSLLLSLIVGPAVGALAGLGLFALLTGFAGRLLSGLVARLLRPLLARISPTAPAAATDHAIAVGLLGAALALVVAFMIPPTATTLKLVAAIGCGVAAFFIGGGRRASPPTALMLLLIGILGVEVAQILLHLLHPLVALATDGGQIECQYANKPYWLCEGSATVLAISVGTATASAAGGTGGLFVGQTIAAVTTGFDPQLLSDLLGQPSTGAGQLLTGGPTDAPPGGGTQPGGDAQPGGGAQPGGDAQPGGGTPPGGDAQPGGGAQPGGDAQPGGGTPPGGGTQPGDTVPPAGSPPAGPGGQPPGAGLGGTPEDTVTHTYDSQGNIRTTTTTHTDPVTGVVTITTTGPDGQPLHTVIKSIDPGTGAQTTTTLNAQGQPTRTTTTGVDANGNTVTTTSNSQGNPIGSTVSGVDANGNTVTTTFNSQGSPTHSSVTGTDPVSGTVTTTNFNSQGQPTGSTTVGPDPSTGGTTTTTFNAQGQPVHTSSTFTDVNGNTVTAVTNAQGQPVNTTVSGNDGQGNSFTNTFNAQGNPVHSTTTSSDPVTGTVTTTTTNAQGQPIHTTTTSTDASGQTTTTVTNSQGQPVHSTTIGVDANGNLVTTNFNAQGQPTHTVVTRDDGQGNSTSTSYGPQGTVTGTTTTTTDPVTGTITTVNTGPQGTPVSSSDTSGLGDGSTTRVTTDPWGHPVSVNTVTDPATGAVTTITTNAQGTPTISTTFPDSGSGTTTVTTDPGGQTTTQVATPPDPGTGATTTVSTDPAGRATTTVAVPDPSGNGGTTVSGQPDGGVTTTSTATDPATATSTAVTTGPGGVTTQVSGTDPTTGGTLTTTTGPDGGTTTTSTVPDGAGGQTTVTTAPNGGGMAVTGQSTDSNTGITTTHATDAFGNTTTTLTPPPPGFQPPAGSGVAGGADAGGGSASTGDAGTSATAGATTGTGAAPGDGTPAAPGTGTGGATAGAGTPAGDGSPAAPASATAGSETPATTGGAGPGDGGPSGAATPAGPHPGEVPQVPDNVSTDSTTGVITTVHHEPDGSLTTTVFDPATGAGTTTTVDPQTGHVALTTTSTTDPHTGLSTSVSTADDGTKGWTVSDPNTGNVISQGSGDHPAVSVDPHTGAVTVTTGQGADQTTSTTTVHPSGVNVTVTSGPGQPPTYEVTDPATGNLITNGAGDHPAVSVDHATGAVTVTNQDPETGGTWTNVTTPEPGAGGLTTTVRTDPGGTQTWTVIDPRTGSIMQEGNGGNPVVSVDPQHGTVTVINQEMDGSTTTSVSHPDDSGAIVTVTTGPTGEQGWSVTHPTDGSILAQGAGGAPGVTVDPSGVVHAHTVDPVSGDPIATTTTLDPGSGLGVTSGVDPQGNASWAVHDPSTGTVLASGDGLHPHVAVDPQTGAVTVTSQDAGGDTTTSVTTVDPASGLVTQTDHTPDGQVVYTIHDAGGNVVQSGLGEPTVTVNPTNGDVTVSTSNAAGETISNTHTDPASGLNTTYTTGPDGLSTYAVTDPHTGVVLSDGPGLPTVSVDPQTGAITATTVDPATNETTTSVTTHDEAAGLHTTVTTDPQGHTGYSIRDAATGGILQEGDGTPVVTASADGSITVTTQDPGGGTSTHVTTAPDPATGLATTQHTLADGTTGYTVTDAGGQVVADGAGTHGAVSIDPRNGNVVVTSTDAEGGHWTASTAADPINGGSTTTRTDPHGATWFETTTPDHSGTNVVDTVAPDGAHSFQVTDPVSGAVLAEGEGTLTSVSVDPQTGFVTVHAADAAGNVVQSETHTEAPTGLTITNSNPISDASGGALEPNPTFTITDSSSGQPVAGGPGIVDVATVNPTTGVVRVDSHSADGQTLFQTESSTQHGLTVSSSTATDGQGAVPGGPEFTVTDPATGQTIASGTGQPAVAVDPSTHVVTVTSTDPSTGSTSTHTYDPATDQHTDSVRSTDAQTGLTTTTNADSISGSTFTVTDPAGHVLLQATGEPQVKVDPQTGATSIDTHDPVNDEVTHHQISTGPGGVTVVSSADPTNGSTYSVSDPHTGHLIQQGTGDPLVTTAPDGRIQVGSYDPGKQIGTTTLFDPRTGATSTTTFDLAHSQATSVHQEQVDEPGGYHTTITSDPRGGTTYVVRDQGGTVVAWGSGNPTVAVDPASGRVTVTDPSSQPLPPATDLADPPAAHPAGTAPPDTTKDPAPAEPAHPAHPQDPTPAPTGPDAMVHSLTQPGVTVVPADQTYTLLHQVAPDLVGADATAGGFKLGPPQLSGGQVTVPTEIGNATASVGASPDGHLAVQITGVPTLAPISTGDANAALRPQLDAFNAQLDKAGLKVTGVTVDHGQIVITKAPR